MSQTYYMENHDLKEGVEKMSKEKNKAMMEAYYVKKEKILNLMTFPDALRKSNFFIAQRPKDNLLDSTFGLPKSMREARGDFPVHIFYQSKDRRKAFLEMRYRGYRGDYNDFLIYTAILRFWVEQGCPSSGIVFCRKEMMLSLGMNPNKYEDVMRLEQSLLRMYDTDIYLHCSLPQGDSMSLIFPLICTIGQDTTKKGKKVHYRVDFEKNNNPFLMNSHPVFASQKTLIGLKNTPYQGNIYSFLCCSKDKLTMTEDDLITLNNPVLSEQQREKFLKNLEYGVIRNMQERGLIKQCTVERKIDPEDGRKYKQFHFKLNENSLKILRRL